MKAAPPSFLIGRLPSGRHLWAVIDPGARFLEAAIGESRFAAYLKPFVDEPSAREALAGAEHLEPEMGRRRRRG